MFDIVFHARSAMIGRAVEEVCRMALLINHPIKLIFREIELEIKPGSSANIVVDRYYQEYQKKFQPNWKP